MAFDYESWLRQAQDRLESLYQQRAAIDEEIAGLQRGIEGFSPLVKKPAPWEGDTIGITEAVTRVFTDSPNQCFSPTAVRDALLLRADVKLKQQNPLATIHQIIARLAARGVIKASMHDGRTLYYHQPSNAGASGGVLRKAAERAPHPPYVPPATIGRKRQVEENKR
jgi:hypothetical protein